MIFDADVKAIQQQEGILFSYNIGAMSGSSNLQLNFESISPLDKYVPFDSVTITNASSSNVIVYINMDINKAIPINAGVIESVSGYGINSLLITNDATAITTGQIRLTLECLGMNADKWAKMQAQKKNVFSSFFGIFG